MLRAALSPDGHTVAFSSPSNGIFQIFVMLTAGGDPLQLTKDESDKTVDSFSADGTEIYYRRTLGQEEEWAIPTLGGRPQRVASGVGLATSAIAFTITASSNASMRPALVASDGIGSPPKNTNPALSPRKITLSTKPRR